MAELRTAMQDGNQKLCPIKQTCSGHRASETERYRHTWEGRNPQRWKPASRRLR
jgi:hypothetical protein